MKAIVPITLSTANDLANGDFWSLGIKSWSSMKSQNRTFSNQLLTSFL